MAVLPWDLFVLLACVAELVIVRLLVHRAFHRGYKAAKDVYALGRQDDDFWERQRALAQEPKRA